MAQFAQGPRRLRAYRLAEPPPRRYRSADRKSRRTSGRLFSYFARAMTMKPDIRSNYHMIKVVMTNGVEFVDPLDLWRRGRDAAIGHRSQHASGLDRRIAAARRSRRPIVALQQPLCRPWHRRQEIAGVPLAEGRMRGGAALNERLVATPLTQREQAANRPRPLTQGLSPPGARKR